MQCNTCFLDGVHTNNIEILWCDAKRNSQGDETLLVEVEHTVLPRRVDVEEKVW